MELLVAEGDGPFRSHFVCPHEGSCLQKVMARCRFGHGLRRKFAVSWRSRDIKGRQPWTRSLASSIGALISGLVTVLSTVFRRKEVEESRRILCGFCSQGSLKESPSTPPT